MKSGESAVGKFPVESIEVMAKIASATISNFYEDSKFKSQQPNYETAQNTLRIFKICYPYLFFQEVCRVIARNDVF